MIINSLFFFFFRAPKKAQEYKRNKKNLSMTELRWWLEELASFITMRKETMDGSK